MLYYWFYEPDKIRIKLNEKYRLFLINKLKKLGGPHSLSRKIECSPATICNYFKGYGLSIGFLKKILDILQIPYEEVEPFITEISWIKNPKLPFNLKSREAATLSAAILGDGSNTTRVMYKNTRQELIKKVEDATKKIFGNIALDHRISEDNINYIVFPRIVGRALTFMGIPYGNKINRNIGIPKIIKNGSKEVQKEFLQQFFDDEGGVETDYRKIFLSQGTNCTKQLGNFYNRMTFKKDYYKRDISSKLLRNLETPKIIVDIKSILLNSFNIESIIRFKRIRRYNNHATSLWELEIGRKNDIEKFHKNIDFYSRDKKKNLEFMVNRSYKMPWNIYNMIINESIKITQYQNFFKPSNISKNLNLPHGPVNKRIKFLKKIGVYSKNKDGLYSVNIKVK